MKRRPARTWTDFFDREDQLVRAAEDAGLSRDRAKALARRYANTPLDSQRGARLLAAALRHIEHEEGD